MRPEVLIHLMSLEKVCEATLIQFVLSSGGSLSQAEWLHTLLLI